jgi:KDO2-lipid IV(A) lauroyltransferase
MGSADALKGWAPYAALRLAASTLHLFGIRQNLRTAGAIGDLFATLGPRRVERAVRHVRWAFPELSETQARTLAMASVRHMFQLFLVDSVAGPQVLNRNGWPEHVALDDLRPTMRLLVQGRPALFVTGHMGNWEFLGLALSMLGFRMSALARPLDNPFLNAWLLGMRQRRGLEVLTKWGATTEVQRVIESGGRVGFIADQNAGDDGVFVPFFGRLASTYKSIGLLALRYRLPIVVGAAIREGDRLRYRIVTTDVIQPDECERAPDPMFYATARFNRAIEASVRIAPSQYLWIHRRWKSRPSWEREGKPMPERVRRRLLELPWLDEAEVDAIAAATAPPESPRGDA